jgi:hypothetical protein
LFLLFWYLVFRCVLQLVLLRPRSTEFKELEIVCYGISWRYFVGGQRVRS